MSEISERLKQLRINNGYTLQSVSDAIGMHYANYARYEYGTRTPTIEALSKLSDLYNVSVDYIIGKTANPKRN